MTSREQKQKCAVCGQPITGGIIKQKVGEDYYSLDKEKCATILNRLYSAYGNDFCLMLKE